MSRVLITAFEPYDRWKTNSSWLTLVQLMERLPDEPAITTRLYPVDFAQVKDRLAKDLTQNYDYAIHLGQAPGSSRVQLEAIAINVGGSSQQSPDEYLSLSEDGPVAYRSSLPLAHWADKLRRAGIPAQVSYHAGTYLCNATLYWTSYLVERMSLKTQSAFVHLPLDVSQAIIEPHGIAALPTEYTVSALRLILEDLA